MGRILVVDDEPLLLRVFERLLGKRWYVEGFMYASDAIEAHHRLPFDLAFVDIHLVDADGPVLAVRLAQVAPIHCVLMSGDPEPEDWDGPVLAKPFDNGAVKLLTAAFFEKRVQGG